MLIPNGRLEALLFCMMSPFVNLSVLYNEHFW